MVVKNLSCWEVVFRRSCFWLRKRPECFRLNCDVTFRTLTAFLTAVTWRERVCVCVCACVCAAAAGRRVQAEPLYVTCGGLRGCAGRCGVCGAGALMRPHRESRSHAEFTGMTSHRRGLRHVTFAPRPGCHSRFRRLFSNFSLLLHEPPCEGERGQGPPSATHTPGAFKYRMACRTTSSPSCAAVHVASILGLTCRAL